MKHRRLFASAPSALALAFLGTGALSAAAQGGGGPPVMAELPLRSIGPAVMSGRVSDLAVVPGRPWEFYVGTASGGLFRTRNNGATWDPLFDHFGTTSIGAVALSPSDPATVWVGTGEPANRQSSSFGDGVYVSLDGGDSFRHRGLETSEHIGRIVVDPDRPLRAFVAALGPLWRSGGERGVFRTDDGGENWEQVLEISADTGVVDLEMDPRNPAILYAAAYTRRRTPWGFNGGGPEGGIFRSRDGGDSWERLGGGLPEGPVGRIGLEIAASDPLSVFALVEHETESGVWRSRDRGATWERISDLNPRPMYYSHIEVDPGDIRRVYVLGSQFHFSDDGGRTFRENRDMTAHLRHRRPRGPPRAVRGPGRRLAPAAGRRRRDLRVVGPGGLLAEAQQHPAHPVLRDLAGPGVPLQHLRRRAGHPLLGGGPPPRGTRPAS